MCCPECGANIDELNESQPVCPGCGYDPASGSEAIDFDAHDDEGVSARMPSDLQEALDDAEALLLATGHVMFDGPKGPRLFRLPTERLM